MISGVMGVICQISVFMICVQTIIHFRPKASYEKYLRMLVSIMLLMQIFLAVGGFFSPEGKNKLVASMQKFTEELNEGMRQATEKALYTYGDMGFEITGENPYGEAQREQQETFQDITVQIEPIAPITVDGKGECYCGDE